MLDKGHCLSETLSCLNFVATKVNKTQPTEPIATVADTVAPRDLPHVSVDSDEDRVIRQSGRRNYLIRGFLRQHVPMEYDGMASRHQCPTH